MSKRRRNPHTNSYVCGRTPNKARYLKAAFAWVVGAKRVKETGVALYLYKCGCCDGWHLTRDPTQGATKIDTAAAPAEPEPE